MVFFCLFVFFLFSQAPGNSIHQLMMSSMAKWYEGGERFDQMRLSRILDVAQDLKVRKISAVHCWMSL